MENFKRTNSEFSRFRTPRGCKWFKANVIANEKAVNTAAFFGIRLPKLFALIEKELTSALPNHKLKYELRLGDNTWNFEQVCELSAFFCKRAKNNGVFFGVHVLTIYGFTKGGIEVDFRKSILKFKFRNEHWKNMDNSHGYRVPVMECEELFFPFVDEWDTLLINELIYTLQDDFGISGSSRTQMFSS